MYVARSLNVDADGIAFASIQALHEQAKTQKTAIGRLQKENADLKAQFGTLKTQLDTLNTQLETLKAAR